MRAEPDVTTGFRIREARGGDKAAIGEMWRELMAYHRAQDSRFTVALDGEAKYLRHVHEMMRSRDARVLVAEEILSGAVVGYVMGEIQHRPPIALPGLYGFISDIYIRENWRQHGVGRAMFETLRRWFVDRKAQAIQLYISEANPQAIAFWQAMGLEPFLRLMHLDLEGSGRCE